MRRKIFSMFAALFFLIGILGAYHPMEIPVNHEKEDVPIHFEIQPRLQAVDILSKIVDFLSAADTNAIHSIVHDLVRQTPLLLFAAVWLLYFVFHSIERYIRTDERQIPIFHIITFIHWIDGKKKTPVLIPK